MIHSQDEETLQAWLGTIPEPVAKECAYRTRMLHARGSSGPLGTVALIDLVRSFGLGPVYPAERAAVTDWRRVPPNAAVEVLVGSEWLPATFLGHVAQGSLEVRLRGQDARCEVYAKHVRLAEKPAVDSVAPNSGEDPNNACQDVPREPEPVPAEFPAATEPEAKLPDVPAEFSWESAPSGLDVQVRYGEKVLDGTFLGSFQDGTLNVLTGVIPRRFEAKDVWRKAVSA